MHKLIAMDYGSLKSKAADLEKQMLAQQAVIEQMREAVKNSTEHWNGHPEYERVASLQPDLSALREHDVEALTTFFEHFAEGKYLEIEADEFQRYIERIRKGE